ncbi:hypothetical protein D9756_011315 [Leucocoprinus leucothites]|uniref:Uncharacterized protein n=1 Tax=Leucocoprinus leucothites TaxID=201217 RepID=A0A8H5FPG6_9AGAR|nr:hypothetical protein D9756_011315 [Leucoagaricus leucothites]
MLEISPHHWPGLEGAGEFKPVPTAVTALIESKYIPRNAGGRSMVGLYTTASLAFGYYKLRKIHGDPFKPIDWATVKATVVTEDGYLAPSVLVEAIREIIHSTDKIIIKGNTRIPNLDGLRGIHHSFVPPNHQPSVVTHSRDRIGLPAMPINPDRLVASSNPNRENTSTNASSATILVLSDLEWTAAKEFVSSSEWDREYCKPDYLWTGNGAVQAWMKVLQELGSLHGPTPLSASRNSPETIRHIHVIAIDTPLEVNIYGQANPTRAFASRMMLNDIRG